MGKKKLRPGTVVYILLLILGMILLVGQFRREEQTTLCLNPTQGKVDLFACPYLARLRDDPSNRN